jgi:phosphomevalonate kinase
MKQWDLIKMSTEKFRLEDEQALIENELTEYRKLIQKLREKSKSELSEESKPECLSNLAKLSINSTNTQLSKEDNMNQKLRDLANRIIRTYR